MQFFSTTGSYRGTKPTFCKGEIMGNEINTGNAGNANDAEPEEDEFSQKLTEIFSQDALLDEAKAKEIIDLKSKIEQLAIDNRGQFESIIHGYILGIISDHLGDCTTAPQIALLDLLGSFTELMQPWQSFMIMNQVGLLKQVRSILNEKFNLESISNIDKPFSDTLHQLTRITLRMAQIADIGGNTYEIIGKIITRSLSDIHNKYKEQSIQQQKQQQQQEEEEISPIYAQEEFDNSVEKMLKLMVVIGTLCYPEPKGEYFLHELQIHKLVAPLMHLNCSKELNCPHRIEIKMTEKMRKLQGWTYKALGDLVENGLVAKYLIKENDAIQHLTFPIIEMSKSEQLQQTDSLEVLKDKYHIVFMSFAFLTEFTEYWCEYIIAVPNFIQSLINLKKYKREPHETELDLDEKNVRTRSVFFLGKLWKTKDEKLQQNLVLNMGYIQALMEPIGLASGSNEQYQSMIFNAISSLNDVLGTFRGLNYQRSDSILLKLVEEEIEEQGCADEIESALYLNHQVVQQKAIKDPELNQYIYKSEKVNEQEEALHEDYGNEEQEEEEENNNDGEKNEDQTKEKEKEGNSKRIVESETNEKEKEGNSKGIVESETKEKEGNSKGIVESETKEKEKQDEN
ncbi:MAG: hypothetical protein EZS28_016689 [Streblomastix strix]|uniref:Uncharacterized protein n=1 Tax=Streblomastix strix TaxID=222440 RepID=A0A5J4VZX0_9EUKA|nr:MAG: hypothetical protein EZS28_016689 [Streblomastix strix]